MALLISAFMMSWAYAQEVAIPAAETQEKKDSVSSLNIPLIPPVKSTLKASFFNNDFLTGKSAGINDDKDDFNHYKYYYRKSWLNGWVGLGKMNNDIIKGSFFSFYGEWLQKSNPKKKAYVGALVSFSKYKFALQDQITNKFDTSKTHFVGNGSELSVEGKVLWSRDNRVVTNSFLSFGLKYIKQNASDAFNDFNEAYTLAKVGFQVEGNSNYGVAFNRSRLTIEAQWQMTESSEKTNFISGDISKGYVYDHTMWSLRFEQNFLSMPIQGTKIAFVIAGVGQYTHLEEGMHDLYSLGGQLSIYNNYNEALMFYYGKQFKPSKTNEKSIFNQQSWWIAVNVPEVIRVFTDF